MGQNDQAVTAPVDVLAVMNAQDAGAAMMTARHIQPLRAVVTAGKAPASIRTRVAREEWVIAFLADRIIARVQGGAL